MGGKRKHKIAVQGSGIVFNCDEDDSILGAMIHNGKGPLSYGCCGGGCGICRAKIISGKFFMFRPMSAAHINDADLGRGIFLLCCIQPRSDMVITAGEK